MEEVDPQPCCSFRKRLAVCDSIRQKHRALASRRKEKDKTSRHRGHSRLHREVNREAAPLVGRPGADDQRTHDSVRSLRFEVWPSLCRLPPQLAACLTKNAEVAVAKEDGGKRRWGSRWQRIKKMENEATEGTGGGEGKLRREEDKNEALALPVLLCVPCSD